MSYIKQTWVDRAVEFFRRFSVTEDSAGNLTLAEEPGIVTSAGTPLDATRLNHIENGIEEVSNNLNLVQSDIDSHEALKSTHGVAPVELWSGVETVNGTTINLSEAITNFHFVVVVGQYSGYSNQALVPLILPTAMIDFGATNNTQMLPPYINTIPAMHVRFSDSTHLYVVSGLDASARVRKVYGLLRK